MQIELVPPATDESAMQPRLGLGILAALTPPEHEIIFTDEIIAPLWLETLGYWPLDLMQHRIATTVVARTVRGDTAGAPPRGSVGCDA